MDFKDVVVSRRSMRAYDDSKTVTKDQIEEIVKMASYAPSWKNSQTARYYAVLDKDKCQEFATKCLPEFNIRNSKGAAYIVTSFVSGNSGFDTARNEATNECGDGWGYYDLGLNNENLLLAAKEAGLDTLVMGIRDAKAIREEIGIPDEEIIVSVIAIGYGTKDATMPKRKDISEILHFV